MHAALTAATGCAMMALPVFVAVWLVRRLAVPWALVGAGALTFVLSQVVHIPLNLGVAALFGDGLLPTPPAAALVVLVPLALGLSSGLCEEGARWLTLRFWQRRARGWGEAVALGWGHGGVEAFILGGLVLLTLAAMVQARGMDFAAMGMTPETQALAQQQLDAFWGAPLWMVPLALVERCLTVPIHVGLNVMVMRAVQQARWQWLAGAVLAHAALNAGAVAIVPHGALYAEAWVALFTVAAVVLVWRSRPATAPPGAPPAPPPPLNPRRLDLPAAGRALEAP